MNFTKQYLHCASIQVYLIMNRLFQRHLTEQLRAQVHRFGRIKDINELVEIGVFLQNILKILENQWRNNYGNNRIHKRGKMP